MATGVIHFGVDDCSRVLVLQNAGYSVSQCCFISELKTALEGSLRPSATLFSEASGFNRIEAVSLIRNCALHTPIIYFSNLSGLCDEQSGPDLLVPPFTAPERWLRWVASVIDQSRAVRAASISLREKTAMRSAQSSADMEDFMRCVPPAWGKSGLPN